MKKLKKFLPVLLVALLMAAVFAVPAFAQEATPPDAPQVESVQQSLSQIAKALFELVIALLAIGVGSERGTQLVKIFWNLVTDKIYPAFNLRNERAFILAAVCAFFFTYYFNINVTQFLQLFEGFDADLLQTINALLVFFVSTKIHGE